MTKLDVFLHSLTLELGYKSIRELKNSLSVKEIFEWQEYYSLKPFGHDRNEIQLAVLSHMFSAVNGGKSKGYLDFMVSDTSTEKRNKIINDIKNF